MPSDLPPFFGIAQDFDIDNEKANGFGRKDTSIDLRKEDRTVDVVSYIVANPVRRGLCRTVCEYPYSGSSRYELADLVNAVQWKPTPALG